MPLLVWCVAGSCGAGRILYVLALSVRVLAKVSREVVPLGGVAWYVVLLSIGGKVWGEDVILIRANP